MVTMTKEKVTKTKGATVYTNGQKMRVEPGTKVGDFARDGFQLVLRSPDGTMETITESGRRLKPREELVVAPKGVAG